MKHFLLLSIFMVSFQMVAGQVTESSLEWSSQELFKFYPPKQKKNKKALLNFYGRAILIATGAVIGEEGFPNEIIESSLE